jgi:hypothetical protein
LIGGSALAVTRFSETRRGRCNNIFSFALFATGNSKEASALATIRHGQGYMGRLVELRFLRMN